MNERIVLSSDHGDSHGEVMTKEALESGAETINSRRKVRWSVEHKRDLPPFGKIRNAKVEEKNGHYYLTAEQIEYDVYEDIDWDKDLIKASCSKDDNPLNEPDFDIPKKLEINIDRHNFKFQTDFENYVEFLRNNDLEINIGKLGRKAEINDPEIVLRIAEYYFIYELLKPTITKATKKIVDKISDKIAQDSEKLYDFIRNSVKEMFLRAIPKNRPVNYVIKFPGYPEIELFARIKDPEILIKALKEKKLEGLRKEISDFEDKVKFEKIQFTLTDKGKWKFNYLLTEKGETIGRKVSFKKRDKKLELVKKAIQKRKK